MATITVENGQSIQDAIDKANGGDEIIVKKGSYNERLFLIEKHVSIRGESSRREDMPVIWSSFDDYDGFETSVVHLAGSICTFENLIIRENESGKVPESESALDFSDNGPGPALILVESRSNAKLKNVFVEDSAMAGIVAHECVEIESCEITGNYGVFVKAYCKCQDSVIHDCKGSGVSVLGGVGGDFTDCMIFDNKQGVWLDGEETNPSFDGCAIFGNEKSGVHIQYAALGYFECCNIFGNKGSGIHCINDTEDFDYDDEENYPRFTDCNVFNNEGYGVELDGVPIEFESGTFNNKGGDVNDENCGIESWVPWHESQKVMFKEEAVVEEGATSIGFEEHLNLKKVSFPSALKGLKEIGDSSFKNCFYLPFLEIPNGVETIESYAFNFCASLEKVTFPDSIKSIESGAFTMCPRLRSVSVPASAQVADDAFDSWCKVIRR